MRRITPLATGCRGARHGMVLPLVVVVIAVLTLSALTFSQLMLAERQATILAGKQTQTRLLAESGIEGVRMLLMQDDETLFELGGLYHNPEQLRGVMVAPSMNTGMVPTGYDPRETGRFTLLAPELVNGVYSGIRFGLEDESSRINLNAIVAAEDYIEGGAQQVLLALPGMDEYTADAILDWIDEDDEPREFGAEQETYSSLEPPYAPKNGPLETLEELLLVQGVTPWLLFGVDANHNGYPDASEPDPMSFPDEMVDNSDGSMNRGWAAHLTLHSMETNLNSEGEEKINVNSDDLSELYTEVYNALGSNLDQATFIIVLRQAGPYTGSQQGEAFAPDKADPSIDPEYELKSLLDLIGVRVQMPSSSGSSGGQGGGQSSAGTVVQSPFSEEPAAMAEYLPQLIDALTVVDEPVIPGRININQAPEMVLNAIPGIDTEVVRQIISEIETRGRDPLDAPEPYYLTEYWPLIDGIVTLDQMREMAPYICGRGGVYRTQIVGYFDAEGPATRLEVLLDATTQPAAVLFWRDMTHLGRGYPLDVLGTEMTLTGDTTLPTY